MSNALYIMEHANYNTSFKIEERNSQSTGFLFHFVEK
jgi:hypothetical protein